MKKKSNVINVVGLVATIGVSIFSVVQAVVDFKKSGDEDEKNEVANA